MTDIQKEIIYDGPCPVCIDHANDLTLIKSIEESVKKNFPDWPIDRQADLVVNWFEKDWKSEMALRIERSKKEASDRIQGFKKANIAALNKERS